jgi:hypothetical protein
MLTSENRPKYNRDKLRYPSDLTNDDVSHVEPLIPPAKRGGRKRSVEPREIGERPHVCAEHGMPVALCSQRPAAEEHAVWLFRPLELGRQRWIAFITRST